MTDPSQDDNAITTALRSRHIPHSRSKPNQRSSGKGEGKGGGSSSTTTTTVFNPLRTFGHYEVHLGSNSKRAKQRHSNDPQSTSPSSWLEIHALTDNEDGLIGTFNFLHSSGEAQGMCALAGSRKGLNGIVSELELEPQLEDHHSNEESAEPKQDPDDEDDDDDDANADPDPAPDHFIQPPPSTQPHNTRFKSFEKNTFRNPKFWIRWRGHVQNHKDTIEPSLPDNSTTTETETETNSGYIIFASNASDKFEGTISCQKLGWDNLKMTGWRTRAKGRPCPVRWMDFV